MNKKRQFNKNKGSNRGGAAAPKANHFDRPNGNTNRQEGGYRNPNSAAMINGGNANKNASSKFGASADVPSKLTFGRQSITWQAGFNNQMQVMNAMINGSNGSFGLSYNNAPNQYYRLPPALRSMGIMTVILHDYLGANNNEEKSPLNLAALLHKQYIDTSLGEQLTFSCADLGVYMGGIKSAWDILYFIMRAINLSHNDKDRANYRTKGLYKALHITKESHPGAWVDPSEEIASRAPIYLENMNAIIKRLNTIPVPDNMRWLLAYTEAVYTQVYTDDAQKEYPQMYVCIPAGWYEYDETNQETDPNKPPKYYNGAHLDWVDFESISTFNDGYVSIAELIAQASSMVNTICDKTNSDFIAQKIFNAYGTANVLKFPTFDSVNDLVPIVYDEDFLESLENARIIPEAAVISKDYTIDAAREMIMGRPLFKMKAGEAWSDDVAAAIPNFPLQFHCGEDAIDAHKISNALRWHPYVSFFRDDATDANIKEVDFANNFGFQVVTGLEITYLTSGNTLVSTDLSGQNVLSDYLGCVLDFSRFPVPTRTAGYTVNANQLTINDAAYTAFRDTEVTIAGEDVSNYFWSLAEMVWDVVDGHTAFGGQRNKLG